MAWSLSDSKDGRSRAGGEGVAGYSQLGCERAIGGHGRAAVGSPAERMAVDDAVFAAKDVEGSTRSPRQWAVARRAAAERRAQNWRASREEPWERVEEGGCRKGLRYTRNRGCGRRRQQDRRERRRRWASDGQKQQEDIETEAEDD